jgi:hypothetical protein
MTSNMTPQSPPTTYDAVHRLRIHVHYVTCAGVGEDPRRAGGEFQSPPFPLQDIHLRH